MRAFAATAQWTEPQGSGAAGAALRVYLVRLSSGEWTIRDNASPNEAELRLDAAGALYADTTVTGAQRLALNAANQLLVYEV